MYRDEEAFDFLVDKKCYDTKVFCNEPFDNDLIEHATPARIERLCGFATRKRYADLKAKMVSERAAEEQKSEEDRKRKIAECIKDGVEQSFCEMLNRKVVF